jgi:peptidoglycan hydrolase-like protein with peptidoglycan-binding domain
MASVINLSKGSKGDEVKKLQKALVDAGYDVGNTGIDGSFGSKTLAAVKQYQKDNGLKVDGIAGKNTLGALFGTGNTQKPPATTPTTNTGGGAKPKEEAPKTEPPAEGTTSTGTPPEQPPVFAYNDFTYDDFTYGDFSYDKPFSYDDFSYDNKFSYGDFSYGTFAPSENVTAANNLLQQQQANKPGSYTPVWQDEADAYLNKYQNRDPFSYDFNSDALYNQYKDNYIQQGQMAMMDAMGQAATMTGGYGNSYAQTVGQQAYNQQLSQLNNIMPELYGMAYDRYNQEGQDLLKQYDLYMNREAQEYGKHQDSVDRWYQEMNRLTNDYNTLYDRELNEYNTAYDRAWNEHNLGYNQAWNEYELGYNQAWDKYKLGYDQAWNEYNMDYDHARDEYNMGYDKAWNEYQDGKNTAYNDYLTGRSEAFTEHQNTIDRNYQQERDKVADAQWEKNYQLNEKSVNNSQKTQTKTPDAPKYETLDYENQQKWGKKFETATSLADVEDICDQMEIAGFDPEDVAWYFNKYSKKFSGGPKPKLQGSVGAGSAGIIYTETK